jgi:uncharacterized membrane protein
MSDVREASVETGNDRLPGGALVQTGPFLILAIGALWLRSRWDELPARLPIHWNWRGEVDRYVPRSVLGASLPILLGVALCLLMMAMQYGIRHRAPRGAMRALSLKLVLAVEYFTALGCCGVLAATLTAGRLLWPVLALAFVGALLLLGLTVSLARGVEKAPPRNPGAWHAGFIYFDRDDPALFVPKRGGFGYTFNFGNPFAVLLMVALLAVPILFALLALSAR